MRKFLSIWIIIGSLIFILSKISIMDIINFCSFISILISMVIAIVYYVLMISGVKDYPIFIDVSFLICVVLSFIITPFSNQMSEYVNYYIMGYFYFPIVLIVIKNLINYNKRVKI